MEHKTMRELDAILKDLNLLASDIKTKRTNLEKLSNEQSLAFQDLETAQAKARDLRAEMDAYMELLVPTSGQSSRVR